MIQWYNICIDCWWIDRCGELAGIENLGNYLHLYRMCHGFVFYYCWNDPMIKGSRHYPRDVFSWLRASDQ